MARPNNTFRGARRNLYWLRAARYHQNQRSFTRIKRRFQKETYGKAVNPKESSK